MAGRMCNTNRLVQRVGVFVSEFVRKTYGFLTPDHVAELRALRNKVEDNYPACAVSEKISFGKNAPVLQESSETETETETDTPPCKKREREPSDDVKEHHPSIYKDNSSPENSDPFTTPTKKKSPDSEWTGSTNDAECKIC